MILQEYVGNEVPEDKNVVMMNGVWQRWSRISNESLCKLLVDESDEHPMTVNDLSYFQSDFSYEFAAFMAKSQDGKGILDCWEKLQSMRISCNTWYYLVKVWCAEGEHPSASDLRTLRYEIEAHGRLGTLHFALGHDKSLKSGETKMLAVTHYNERCFPAHYEFDWNDAVDEYCLPELKTAHRKLSLTITKYVFPEYRAEVLQDQWDGSITGMKYNKKRKWKDTLLVLEWLRKFDNYSLQKGIRGMVDNFDWAISFRIQKGKSECSFYLRKLEWVLKNGANVNIHRDGESALDLIRQNDRVFLEDKLSEKNKIIREDMKRCCEALLLKYGAKTMTQIREEEATNEDYKVELQRMSE